MRDIPHRRREQAHKAFRIGLALLVIISLPIGIAAAQTADEPEPCPDGPPIRGDSGQGIQTEIVLVNDISGSVGGSGLAALKEGNAELLSNLNGTDEAGAVSYGELARIDNNLTRDYAAVNDSIQSYELVSDGHPLDGPLKVTNGGRAIENATEVLLNNSNATEDATKTMILFTDGEFNDQSEAETAAQYARDNNITIYAIGLGTSISEQNLIDITGSEDRYYSADEANLTEIYLSIQEDVRALSTGLRVETRDLYRPGETHGYTVTEIIEENGTVIESNDVTDSANITINSAYNGTLFTVNDNGTLTAVDDKDVSDWARIDATYNNSGGCTNAIVSEPNVKNIELVPGIWRLNALIGDSTIFFIILATLAAVAMTRFTSSFGGIAVAQVVMAVGWLAGYVPWAFAAASVFIGLFIGLNLAANIDYSVGRFNK